jgi:hypothetical protein
MSCFQSLKFFMDIYTHFFEFFFLLIIYTYYLVN